MHAWFRRWLRFGLPAVAARRAALMLWTLRSVEGNSHFLRIGLDWVNQGQENWLWFWLKNVGLVFAMTPFALVFCPREQRPVFSGAALIFVLGEIVLFQPNPYDNNKLFYVAYLFACFLVADFIMLLVERLKTKPLRAAFLALVVVIGCSACGIHAWARGRVRSAGSRLPAVQRGRRVGSGVYHGEHRTGRRVPD